MSDDVRCTKSNISKSHYAKKKHQSKRFSKKCKSTNQHMMSNVLYHLFKSAENICIVQKWKHSICFFLKKVIYQIESNQCEQMEMSLRWKPKLKFYYIFFLYPADTRTYSAIIANALIIAAVSQMHSTPMNLYTIFIWEFAIFLSIILVPLIFFLFLKLLKFIVFFFV